jgi:hypothetical protein
MRAWQSQRRRIDFSSIATAPRVDAILRHLDVHCAATLDHLGFIEVCTRGKLGVVGREMGSTTAPLDSSFCMNKQ